MSKLKAYGPDNKPFGRLNPRQFKSQMFHASPNALNPGTIIRPQTEHGVAWAGDKARADHHADLLNNGYTTTRYGYDQLALFHPVYEVEPLKTDTTLRTTHAGQPLNKSTFISDKGFRVKKFSHFIGKD